MEVKIIIVGVARDPHSGQILLLKNENYEWPEYSVVPSNSMDCNLGTIVEKMGFDKEFIKPVLLDVQTERRYTDDDILGVYYGMLLPSDLGGVQPNFKLMDANSISFAVKDEEWMLIQKMNHMAVLP